MGSSPTIIYNKKSTTIETDAKNQSGPYVNAYIDYEETNKKLYNITAIEQLQASFKKHADRPCLGYRAFDGKDFADNFTFVNYKDVWSQAETMSKVIVKNGFAPVINYEKEEHYDEETGDFRVLGFFARNCVEWFVSDIACQLSSVTTATFYSTLGDESFEHVFNQTRLSTLFITPENVDVIIKYYENHKFKTLRNVILFDQTLYVEKESKSKLEEYFKKYNINVFYFSNLVKTPQNELSNIKPEISKPDTLFTLCYTSGTTSLPKGAKISQRNIGSTSQCADDINLVFNPNDTHFCYLPLAHMMERGLVTAMLIYGAKVGIISGEARKFLAPEIKILQPTFLVTVPRVLSLFRTMIFDKLNKLTGIKKLLIDRAIATKKANFEYDGNFRHGLYDAIFFKAIRDTFGGRIRGFISGSAPLPKDLAADIKILFSCPILEGYGMTETTLSLVASSYYDYTNRSCGGAVRTSTFKLVDVPELNYHSKTTDELGRPSPTGEICAKGVNIFCGYFRDKKNTNSTIDKDGWLHTGDVGRISADDNGLRIIDRVKEIFKLAQGEYIAPSKLEGAYGLSPWIEQICVHGDSTHTYFISIIFPSKPKCKEFLVGKGLMSESDPLTKVDDFLENKDLHAAIKGNLDEIAKTRNFNSLEKASKLILAKEMFTQQNGLLTDTMKMKRKSFAERFSVEINQAYSK